MRHINIPIFVPHLGCPNTCVFCNQHAITGATEVTVDDCRHKIEAVLSTSPKDAEKEIAFFGGSFTAIDKRLMLRLLSVAKEYVERGLVTSIRLSTRPDAIDENILDTLKQYGVSTIEIGIQSTDNAVLIASKRGHTAQQSELACQQIKKHGFSLVGQMMLGLPESNIEKEIKTARDMINWGIDSARIYPTVVFPDTELYQMIENGKYEPLTIQTAAERGGTLLELFYQNNVPVIRIGLCENEGLHETENIEGAYHPALGEMCLSHFYRIRMKETLSQVAVIPNSIITIEVAPACLSQAIGHNRSNITYLSKLYPTCNIIIKPSLAVSQKEVKIHTKEN